MPSHVLYIGIHTPGTTSRMRADQIEKLMQSAIFDVIDTDRIFLNTFVPFRVIGFRYKTGPLITSINKYIVSNLNRPFYDLIWVDKGVYLAETTMSLLRSKTQKLIHYTPDAAFLSNKSKLFNRSIKFYDKLITTKKFELPIYRNFIGEDKLLVVSQGFDKKVHKPVIPFNQKVNRVSFIGLCEPSREAIVSALLKNEIKIAIAGKNWNKFVKKHRANPYFEYHGPDLRSDSYTSFISQSYFSLGLLSKNFPEKHTTRTFEIPACGTALLTEFNEEIDEFFTSEEVIYFSDEINLVEKIRYYQQHLTELQILTEKGTEKVFAKGYDYENIIQRILEQIGVLFVNSKPA